MPDRRAEKGRLSSAAWEMVRTQAGLTSGLRAAQDAFTATVTLTVTGCTMRGGLCPATPAQWQGADTLAPIMVFEAATGSLRPFHRAP